jgi:hypothetical protein
MLSMNCPDYNRLALFTGISDLLKKLRVFLRLSVPQR